MTVEYGRVTLEEYLAAERGASLHHEYLDGWVYRVALGSIDHDALVARLLALLGKAAGGQDGRQVFGPGVRLYVPGSNLIYCPDVVVCGAGAESRRGLVVGASSIFEVVCASTRSVDRREKRLAYQGIASLREYVAIEEDRMCVDLQWRSSDGWKRKILNGPGDALEVSSLGWRVSLEEIYEKVEVIRPLAEERLDDVED